MSSLLNAAVDSKLVRLRTWNFKRHCHLRSEVYSMVESEPKDEVATFEREFKLRKRITVFLGELNNCTVTFNVGSKQFRFKVYIVKMCY